MSKKELEDKIKQMEQRFELIYKICDENMFEDLDDIGYCMMLSSIAGICKNDFKTLDLVYRLNQGDKEDE